MRVNQGQKFVIGGYTPNGQSFGFWETSSSKRAPN